MIDHSWAEVIWAREDDDGWRYSATVSPSRAVIVLSMQQAAGQRLERIYLTAEEFDGIVRAWMTVRNDEGTVDPITE